MCSDIILKRYYKTILFVEDNIDGECFLNGKYEDSIVFILQVIQQMGAPFSSYIFDQPGHSEDWNFFPLYQSCQFLAWVVFEGFSDGFLACNLRLSWSKTIF